MLQEIIQQNAFMVKAVKVGGLYLTRNFWDHEIFSLNKNLRE